MNGLDLYKVTDHINGTVDLFTLAQIGDGLTKLYSDDLKVAQAAFEWIADRKTAYLEVDGVEAYTVVFFTTAPLPVRNVQLSLF